MLFDQLPLEIISFIVGQLEELDVGEKPHSQFWETPKDTLVHLRTNLYDQADYMNWLLFTNGSRNNICNARLVCRAFYNGSFKSFGKLLGDRRIRITKTGIHDLDCIGNAIYLNPYIQTLTFGTAGFLDSNHANVQDCLQKLNPSDSSRLLSAYRICSEWQRRTNKNQLRIILRAMLQVFPNLQRLRIVHQDVPVNHLGVWLHHESDRRLVDSVQEEIGSLYSNELAKECFEHLFIALHYAKIRIRDFRVSCGKVNNIHLRSLINYYLPSLTDLRTFRIPVAGMHLLPKPNATQTTITKMLIGAPHLEDLSLIVNHGLLRDYPHNVTDIELHNSIEFSTHVFATLSNHMKLRRVAFTKGWAFHEDALIAFIHRHSSSLRCVVLEYPYLVTGCWKSALHRISKMEELDLEFLGVRWPLQRNGDDGKALGEGTPVFKFPVDLDVSCLAAL
ncbi:hypothetical protein K505DRAFT_98261 [Melanomma pulvis-pyrius CBS 109.77]|uniref:Uncharacterized protein n=1 Tax=Melanomma pulvis-pyrius CBS 109.77 TaxID=1314802 RepID=A0A6A6WYI6_9PLEO|nr:hypothetical protein K505DRAFT_98261 [Melanomma pulvis-pyrius CBS 109.77]